MKLKVGVYGLGYVGLPLSIAASRTEYSVVGIDTDLEKISKLNSGVSIVEDITDLELTEAFNSGYYKVTSQGIKGEYFDIILIFQRFEKKKKILIFLKINLTPIKI